jgi:AraC-like DNA-binding protein
MGQPSIPFTQFDTSRMVAAHSFDLWREVVRGAYDLSASDRSSPSLRISTGMWEAERLVLGFCRCEAGRVDRRGTLVGHSGRFLKLRWFSRGEVRLIHGGDTTVIGPGAIHLIDQSREIVEISAAHAQHTVFLPHVVVGYDPSRHPVWLSFPLDRPIGRLLGDAMTAFIRELPRATADEAPPLEAGFIGLARGLLSGALDSAEDESVAEARLRVMKRHLDRRLSEPELGIASLLGAFGATRSTIFRDFRGDGGVDRYILDRRLERAFADLASRTGRRGIVREVLEAWGFESASHFSRLFRERYGMTPGEAVGLNARPSGGGTGEGPKSLSPATEAAAEPDPRALSRVYERIAGAWG